MHGHILHLAAGLNMQMVTDISTPVWLACYNHIPLSVIQSFCHLETEQIKY